MKKENPFTLSFGNKPFEYISRDEEKNLIIENLNKDIPLSHCFIITGVRGSGKTVLLTSIKKEIEKDDEWIVIELNSEGNVSESLIAKLYNASKVKKLFIDTNFSLSFSNISFSIKGNNPIFDSDDVLERIFKELKKQKKKVLLVMDEVINNTYLRKFILSFQMLIREECDLFLLMTGLYENISSLENSKNLTFLIRSPKIFLKQLSYSKIADSYKNSLSISNKEAFYFAEYTKGYAFAFQLLGYLLFEKDKKEIDNDIEENFDNYLKEFSYFKIFNELSDNEKLILKSIKNSEDEKVELILKRTNMPKTSFSKYRDKLIKRGIITSNSYGKISFSLPRFKEFIDSLY